MPPSKLSYAAASILLAVRNDYCYGFDIMDCTGLPSGTVYPALRRLEENRLVNAEWERESLTEHGQGPARAQRGQRPARKYYALTSTGEAALEMALKRYPLLERVAPELRAHTRE